MPRVGCSHQPAAKRSPAGFSARHGGGGASQGRAAAVTSARGPKAPAWAGVPPIAHAFSSCTSPTMTPPRPGPRSVATAGAGGGPDAVSGDANESEISEMSGELEASATPGSSGVARPSEAAEAAGPGVTEAAGPGVTEAAGPGVTEAAGPGVAEAAGPGVAEAAGRLGVAETAGPGG